MEPCFATFHGNGGYQIERENAAKNLEIGKRYTVIGGSIGQTKTDLVLQGVSGSWNSVFFEIEGELPFTFEDSYYINKDKK